MIKQKMLRIIITGILSIFLCFRFVSKKSDSIIQNLKINRIVFTYTHMPNRTTLIDYIKYFHIYHYSRVSKHLMLIVLLITLNNNTLFSVTKKDEITLFSQIIRE